MASEQKAQFTPGPWHVVDATVAESRWVVGTADDCSVATAEPAGPWVSHEEADGNARLIAAAPDLYEALDTSWQLIAELEEAITNGLKLLPADVERIAKCCADNRAALSKARPQ